MSYVALFLALGTIALWSFQSFLGAALTGVPPFLLVGTALTVSGMLGSFKIRAWWIPWRTFVMGSCGIFGYNLLFFTALQHAPPIETSLLNYLWPLLIVLLTPLFFHGYSLRWHHLVGTMVGFLGAILIVTGSRLEIDWSYIAGYLLAASAALVWAVYSLLTKKVKPFSTGAVGVFCLTAGLLSLVIHFCFEPSYLPSRQEWVLVVLLGLGPLGLAYYTWDGAMKLGDPRIIGSLSYLTPLSSTLVLVFLGGNKMEKSTIWAMLFIVGGALLGALDLYRPRKTRL